MFDAVNALDVRNRRHPRAPVTVRVLWLIKGLGPGGAERLLVEHARPGIVTAFRYEVAYVLDWKQHLVPELEALGVPHPLPRRALGARSSMGPRDSVAAPPRALRRRPRPFTGRRVGGATRGPRAARTPTDRRSSTPSTTAGRRTASRRRCANQSTFGLNDAALRGVGRRARLGRPPTIATRRRGARTRRRRRAASVRSSPNARRRAVSSASAPGESLAVTVANLRAGKNYPGPDRGGAGSSSTAACRCASPPPVRGQLQRRDRASCTARAGSVIASRSSATATTQPRSSPPPTCSCSRRTTRGSR